MPGHGGERIPLPGHPGLRIAPRTHAEKLTHQGPPTTAIQAIAAELVAVSVARRPRQQRDPERDCLALAIRQFGVLSRAQALQLGMSEQSIARRLGGRDWTSMCRNVYRITGFDPSWRQVLMAGCLWGPAIASHRSAASL